MNHTDAAGKAKPAWKGLYRLGGVAALIAALVFRRNISAELWLVGIARDIAPATAAEWFALLQNSPVLGLALLDVFDVVNYALIGLILLALCRALYQLAPGVMVLSAVLAVTGVAVYFASNQAFAMLALSQQFAAATAEGQRTALLAAGEALLAINSHGGGKYLSLFLVTLAGLLVSVVMLRSTVFGKTTAWIGVVAHGIGLCFFVALAMAPSLMALPPSISAVFLLVWYLLVGRRLLLMDPGSTSRI